MRTARVVGGGRTIAYEPGRLTSRDSSRIAEGLELGRAQLVKRYGPRGVALLDDATWVLAFLDGGLGVAGEIMLFTRETAAVPALTLRSPVDPRRVEDFVVGSAGAGLSQFSPILRSYASWTASRTEEPQRLAEAARWMALSWSSAGRRCATGVVEACRAVLTVVQPADRLALYFDPSDFRAVVTASAPSSDADSLFFVERRACLGGAQDACERIVGRMHVPDPFAGSLRGTLSMHALELGGTTALDRLVASSSEDPLQLLSETAAVSEDSLISSWQRRTVRALDEERGGQLPQALAVVGWCALALAAAAGRKP